MSRKLRRMSGNEVVRILGEFGFRVHSQRGSHVKLVRVVEGTKQSITIPLHKELDIGTLRAIIRQASRFVQFDSLQKEFWG